MRIDVVSIFPDYLAPLELSLAGKAPRARPARRARPRPARLDPRPAPHRRRHAVRRRGRHGDEARAVGRGARRGAARRRDAGRADAGRGCRSPRRWPRDLADARAPGLRVRPLRGHRPAGGRRRAPAAPRCARSRSATTCSTGERSPRWRSSRPSSGCCRASWATPSRWSRSRTRTACWSTPSTPSRRAWRGREVPAVLLSGDHAADRRVAARRSRYAVPRSAARTSPHRSTLLDDVEVRRGPSPPTRASCSSSSAPAGCRSSSDNPGVQIPALEESLDDVRAWIAQDVVLVARSAGRLVGAVRARLRGDEWDIGRLMVAPDLAGRGLGRALLATDRGRRPARGDVVRAVHRCRQRPATSGCTRRPATACAGEIEPGVVRMTKKRSPRQFPDDFVEAAAVADLLLGPVGQTRVAPRTSSGGGPRRFLPQGEHDAAGQRTAPAGSQLNDTLEFRG